MNPKLYDYGSEQALIGGILLRPENLVKIRAELSPEDFGSERHTILLTAFSEIADRGDPIEPSVIVKDLEKSGNLAKAGGKDYLTELVEAIHTSAGSDYHIEAVKEARVRRTLMNLSDKIRGELNSGTPVGDIMSDLRNLIVQMNEGQKNKIIRLSDALHSTISHIEALGQAKGGVSGIPSGFVDIDHHTGGFQPGEVIIIAGRPGMGKSILAKDFAENAGVPVAYFSLEMSVQELTKRQLAGKGQVNFEALRTGRLTDGDWSRIIEASNSLAKVPIHYIDMANITIDELIAISENIKMNEDVGLVVIDYLQLIRLRSPLQVREREVSEISRKLKGLARGLEIPVICLAQLNRQCEARGKNKRPRLSDLRESGSLEQDADVVAFIYRDHVYKASAPRHEAEFIIAKGRNIRTGTVPLFFDGEHQSFRNAAYQEDEFLRDDPIILAVGGLIYTLLCRCIWMDGAGGNAFIVKGEGEGVSWKEMVSFSEEYELSGDLKAKVGVRNLHPRREVLKGEINREPDHAFR